MKRRDMTAKEFMASLGEGLTEEEQMREATCRGVGLAPLPPLYVAARRALRAAWRARSDDVLEKYLAAQNALQACELVDECAVWPKAAALASYARQAADEDLKEMALKVELRAALMFTGAGAACRTRPT